MLGPRVHTVLSALAAAAAALAALVALPAPARAAQPAPGTAASLLYFQDAHEIAPVTQDGGDHGGIARLATVLNAERARGVPTDTVFGGDLGGGTLFGAVYRGAAMVDALNRVGVGVAGFGQHDFDYGLSQAMANVEASSFSWVSSNLATASGPLLGQEGHGRVRDVGGVRVGYLGLTDGMDTTSAAGEVRQADPVDSARTAVAALEAQGAQVIVAIAQVPREQALEVMNAVPQITVLLREESGFDQEGHELDTLDGGRVVVGPEGNYGSLERIDLVPGPDGTWSASVTSLQVDASVADDPQALALQRHYTTDLDARLSAPIGCSQTGLSRPQPLGASVAQAFRDQVGAQLGWVNAGGLRADLPAGELSMRSALSVLPFDNKVMKIEVTGAQLRAALEQGADSSPAGRSGGYPLTSGFRFTYEPTAAPGSRVTDLVLDDGAPVGDADRYTLAVTSYVVGGGNGVSALGEARVIIGAGFGGADVDALVTALKAHPTCDSPSPSPAPGAPGPADPAPSGSVSVPAATVSNDPAGHAGAPGSSQVAAGETTAVSADAPRPAGLARTGTAALAAGAAAATLVASGVLARRRAARR